ncbi:MAG: leucine--tRNA ligase [bacterium]|nr:leucine--tRNA ligase [bacterium]
MKKYDHTKIEKKWRERWEKEGVYKTGSTSVSKSRKPFDKLRDYPSRKCYVLDMFPYPSGEGLHVGHPKGYIATDVYSRMKKMQGHDILHPMGWDAFGLPAENYAIKNKVHPRIAVEKNIKRFKEQLQLLGFNYDWSREINTTDPEYYKWTQWIFLQMFKKGLAYQSYEPINWCPSCQTGLANEDLDGGACERCGTIVEKKPMRQWVLKITDYAERLLEGLGPPAGGLDWPESIKESQRNWIGKSEGAEIEFLIIVSGHPERSEGSRDSSSRQGGTQNDGWKIRVFTTRPDTLFGATYMVLAPEHELIEKLESRIKNLEEVRKYVKKAKAKIEQDRVAEGKEKTGVELKGIKAINPANGEEIPVFVADYVLATYGTGAIMAVPAHDDRDFEFAKKFGLPIKEVIRTKGSPSTSRSDSEESSDSKSSGTKDFERPYEGEGVTEHSGKFDGMESEKAKWEITKFVKGKRTVKYKLRDWVFSRQRYWGEPIPIIHCDPPAGGCGVVPVPEEELPVKLPEVESYAPTGTGESPLADILDWVNTKCLKCGGKAKRETNTMPQWAGSSWYYLAYIVKEAKSPALPAGRYKLKAKSSLEKWLPVDMYVGGAEHATRHLIYARFWHKFLYDIKVVSTDEPFQRLQHVGLIGGADGRKMSKRYGNVINPDDVVATFGADTLRLYEMFMGPFDANSPWSEDGILGPRRFLERIWRFFQEDSGNEKKGGPSAPEAHSPLAETSLRIEQVLHKTIKKVTEDIQWFRFNTAISALMICFNEMEKTPSFAKASAGRQDSRKKIQETFLKLLFPFAPHMTEEIWREVLGNKNSLYLEAWPEYDAKLIEDETFQLVVQVNGQVRGMIEAKKGISQKDAEKAARADAGVLRYLGEPFDSAQGIRVKKVIFVKDRLINFVLDV